MDALTAFINKQFPGQQWMPTEGANNSQVLL